MTAATEFRIVFFLDLGRRAHRSTGIGRKSDKRAKRRKVPIGPGQVSQAYVMEYLARRFLIR
jgi:hypothetical protein